MKKFRKGVTKSKSLISLKQIGQNDVKPFGPNPGNYNRRSNKCYEDGNSEDGEEHHLNQAGEMHGDHNYNQNNIDPDVEEANSSLDNSRPSKSVGMDSLQSAWSNI